MKKTESYRNLLETRTAELQKLIGAKETALKSAPPGKLHGIRHGSKFHYYHRLRKTDKNGTYIPLADIDFAVSLAQKEYDSRLLKQMLGEQKILKRLLKYQQKNLMEDVFEKMPIPKRVLITPIDIPDKEYIEAWEQQEYEPLKFKEDERVYISAKEEKMRSKSELLIANALERKGIPYRYEKPLEIGDHAVVRPEFTILDVRNRREVYWEHFGMMSDTEYATRAVWKIQAYAERGYHLGENFLATFESETQPLDMRIVEYYSERYRLK